MDALNKSIHAIELYDIYQDLLTKKQKTYIESYYFLDLSITEISENLEVSRNAVHDQIKRAVKKLEDFETALQLNSLNKKKIEIYNKYKKLENQTIDKLIEELEKVE